MDPKNHKLIPNLCQLFPKRLRTYSNQRPSPLAGDSERAQLDHSTFKADPQKEKQYKRWLPL